jgi:hypothetical protein
MDYKYIEQLLERYWQGETTLQEEAIPPQFLHARPENSELLPESLRKYRPLFDLEKEEPLGDDFDARILGMIEEEAQPKAKVVTLTSRLMPLFKAAAIVAILLTLGNAAQAPWNYGWDNPKDEYAKFHQQEIADSVNLLNPIQAEIVSDSALAPKPEAAQYIE